MKHLYFPAFLSGLRTNIYCARFRMVHRRDAARHVSTPVPVDIVYCMQCTKPGRAQYTLKKTNCVRMENLYITNTQENDKTQIMHNS
jgi:hypothetical protein